MDVVKKEKKESNMYALKFCKYFFWCKFSDIGKHNYGI